MCCIAHGGDDVCLIRSSSLLARNLFERNQVDSFDVVLGGIDLSRWPDFYVVYQ